MANTSTPAVRHVSVFTTHVMRASLKMTLQEKSGKVQGDRGVIRFLKNRIYPVFRAKLFRKSDLMLKKCRFALRKHENHPFLAIFAIFGNSVLSQPTIRHTPNHTLLIHAASRRGARTADASPAWSPCTIVQAQDERQRKANVITGIVATCSLHVPRDTKATGGAAGGCRCGVIVFPRSQRHERSRTDATLRNCPT